MPPCILIHAGGADPELQVMEGPLHAVPLAAGATGERDWLSRAEGASFAAASVRRWAMRQSASFGRSVGPQTSHARPAGLGAWRYNVGTLDKRGQCTRAAPVPFEICRPRLPAEAARVVSLIWGPRNGEEGGR